MQQIVTLSVADNSDETFLIGSETDNRFLQSVGIIVRIVNRVDHRRKNEIKLLLRSGWSSGNACCGRRDGAGSTGNGRSNWWLAW